MLLLVAAATIAAASPPEVILIPSPGKETPAVNPKFAAPPRTCPPATPYEAARRGGKLSPRHLDELPPATTYMAVFRHIGGCEAPLTMIEYRNPRRR